MRPYIILLIALILTLTSAAMNISGYITLYAESSIMIAVIFITLELTKASIFGIALTLATRVQKTLLTAFAILLLSISFLGHLSFLSRAYHINKSDIDNSTLLQQSITDSHSTQTQTIDDQIQSIKDLIATNTSELKTIQDNINTYKGKESSNYVYSTSKKRIAEITQSNAELNKQLAELYKQKQDITQQKIDTTKQLTEVKSNIASRSAFIYTASIFGTTQDRLSEIINIVLSLAIDPLALIMLWTGTSMIQRNIDGTKKVVEQDTDYENIFKPEAHTFKSTAPQPVLKESYHDSQPQTTEIKQPELPDSIDIYNAHKYTYQGYTLDDIIKLDTDTINTLKYSMKTKLSRDWLNACITIRNNKQFYQNHKSETKEIE